MSTFLSVFAVILAFVLGGAAVIALAIAAIHYYLNETINGPPRDDK